MTIKTEKERAQFLKSVGLSAEGEALAALPAKPPVAPPEHKPASNGEPVIAPPGVDPRFMAVEDIEFDERLLDRFPTLDAEGARAASAYIFAIYKSPGRDKLRNGALHRKISTFISNVRLSRKTGGEVKERVRTTAEQRDIAQVVAQHDVDAGEVAEALRIRETLAAAGIDVNALLGQVGQ